MDPVLQTAWPGAVPIEKAHARFGDIVSPQTRSRMMAAVRQQDTRAELAVRGILHALGIRYRIRNRDLPGSPDVANRSSGWAIFVNGCFWHGHKNCTKTKSTKGARVPKTRADFWFGKLAANRRRDARHCRELRQMGYRVLIVWECDLFHAEGLGSRLRKFCAKAKRCRKGRK